MPRDGPSAVHVQSLSTLTHHLVLALVHSALEVFCDDLNDHIEPYLPSLMNKLVQLLHHGTRHVQEQSITTISSCANSAGKLFAPYVVSKHVGKRE